MRVLGIYSQAQALIGLTAYMRVLAEEYERIDNGSVKKGIKHLIESNVISMAMRSEGASLDRALTRIATINENIFKYSMERSSKDKSMVTEY
jgi:hypothetical protein